MIDPIAYLLTAGIEKHREIEGGQELILFEIIGALAGMKSVWVPFVSSGTLTKKLREVGFEVCNDPYWEIAPKCDAIYFGTPTIVNNAPLFQDVAEWTKDKEREVVRRLTKKVIAAGYKRLVCGLGSGDISVDERLQDIDGGKVVCFKDFGSFQDWVIARELPNG